MRVLNPQSRLQVRPSFFLSTLLLNSLVAGMFYVVTQTPAPVHAASVPIHSDAAKPAQIVIPAIVGTPVRLIIPSLSIDLPVGTGSYTQAGGWNVDDTKAYYADISMPLNNSNGNTLIYGHAQTPVFIRLPQLQPGALAFVYSDSGYEFSYAYTSLSQVYPNDTTVFRYDGPPTLTLQTCSGSWDTYRSMFLFRLLGVRKV